MFAFSGTIDLSKMIKGKMIFNQVIYFSKNSS
ncbi:hypothetical protein P872_20855 [Rhodonellum psychrophilum GCM71 = DSM 17998]|uniref:Uncharacterized protein n=1 Tax=Rhodonellum psychrophilum GCM71 = DSM 17998 TaxID=1123057 RepID=U5BWW5_9BACT|nr:hypothetical protein P872_20855 [Rhodonellum psychrophilum GCM71 = DSM 17998]